MPLTDQEKARLRAACERLPRGKDHRISDYVSNVMHTVLDFQMKTSVFIASMDHFHAHFGAEVRTHRALLRLVMRYPTSKRGYSKMAMALWGYNHWSRAKFLRIVLLYFDERGIRGQVSLLRWLEKADFDRDIKGRIKTKEHSVGIAIYNWLCLRVGIDTIKPDVHVRNFVKNAVGRRIPDREIVAALVDIARDLPSQNRQAFRLDAAIWHHQRGT